MSDTMEKIAGTLGDLVKKAKELSLQAVEAVDRDGTVRSVYARGAERTKAYAKLARLNVELNRQSEELRRIYTEIGKLYFEQERGRAEGIFAPLFAQAETTASALRRLSDEIEEIKAETLTPDAGKDIEVEIGAFDDVVSADEKAARGE